jgi:hypothetical protein
MNTATAQEKKLRVVTSKKCSGKSLIENRITRKTLNGCRDNASRTQGATDSRRAACVGINAADEPIRISQLLGLHQELLRTNLIIVTPPGAGHCQGDLQ